MVLRKTSRNNGRPREFQNLLPGTTLITVHKAFIRPHLGYCDILYDQACLFTKT